MRKVAAVLILGLILSTFSFADDKDQEMHRALRALRNLENHITKTSNKALLQMFYTDINTDTVNPVGSMFFIMEDGNKVIQKELVKRVDSLPGNLSPPGDLSPHVSLAVTHFEIICNMLLLKSLYI